MTASCLGCLVLLYLWVLSSEVQTWGYNQQNQIALSPVCPTHIDQSSNQSLAFHFPSAPHMHLWLLQLCFGFVLQHNTHATHFHSSTASTTYLAYYSYLFLIFFKNLLCSRVSRLLSQSTSRAVTPCILRLCHVFWFWWICFGTNICVVKRKKLLRI